MIDRWMICGALALAGAMAGPVANAETLPVMLQNGPLKDSASLFQSQSRVYSMLAPSAGSLAVKLDDLDFPTALGNLSFALTTASGVLDTLTGEGEATFDLDGPGMYYAVVSGTGLGKFEMGQFSLSVFFTGIGDPGPTPVPLPAALVLLLSALGGVAGFAKKRAQA